MGFMRLSVLGHSRTAGKGERQRELKVHDKKKRKIAEKPGMVLRTLLEKSATEKSPGGERRKKVGASKKKTGHSDDRKPAKRK